MQIKKKHIYIFVVLSICLFLLPLILNYFFGGTDFSNIGALGDMIGGITSPFVNLTGSILVYLALLEQIKANDIISTQIKGQTDKENNEKKIRAIERSIQIAKNDIADFSFISETTVGGVTQTVTYNGRIAIFEYTSYLMKKLMNDSQFKLSSDPSAVTLIWVLDNLNYCFDLIIKSELQEQDKNNYSRQLALEYRSKIAPAFIGHINNPDKADQLKGVSSVVYSIVMDSVNSIEEKISELGSFGLVK